MGGKQGDEEPARATHVKGDKRRQGAQEPGESHPHEDPERATHMKGDRGGRQRRQGVEEPGKAQQRVGIP